MNQDLLSHADLLYLCTQCGDLSVRKARTPGGFYVWHLRINNPGLSMVGYLSFEKAAHEMVKVVREYRNLDKMIGA